MKTEHVIIVGIGVILFLLGGGQAYTGPYWSGFIPWILGLVLVYLGLKLEQDKKKGESK